MPLPVINPTTSILAYRKGEYFAYQPAATNIPTSWSAMGLPPGMTINPLTGLIQGAPTVQGVYDVTLVASNAEGTSIPLVVPVGVEAVPFGMDASLEIDFDLDTGIVKRTRGGTGAQAKDVLFGKRGDKLVVSVGLIKDGALMDVPLVALTIGVKEFEPDPLIILNDGAFRRSGDYDTTRFQVVVDLDNPNLPGGQSLPGTLGDYEEDAGTGFDGLGEIQLTHLHAPVEGMAMQMLTRSSRNFTFRIERDVVPN